MAPNFHQLVYFAQKEVAALQLGSKADTKPVLDHTDILQLHFFAVHTKKLFDQKEKEMCVLKNGSTNRWVCAPAHLWNNISMIIVYL